MMFARLGRMSGSGRSLPKCVVRDMSGLPPIATEWRTSRDIAILIAQFSFTTGHRYERRVLALGPHIGAALGDEL